MCSAPTLQPVFGSQRLSIPLCHQSGPGSFLVTSLLVETKEKRALFIVKKTLGWQEIQPVSCSLFFQTWYIKANQHPNWQRSLCRFYVLLSSSDFLLASDHLFLPSHCSENGHCSFRQPKRLFFSLSFYFKILFI